MAWKESILEENPTNKSQMLKRIENQQDRINVQNTFWKIMFM